MRSSGNRALSLAVMPKRELSIEFPGLFWLTVALSIWACSPAEIEAPLPRSTTRDTSSAHLAPLAPGVTVPFFGSQTALERICPLTNRVCPVISVIQLAGLYIQPRESMQMDTLSAKAP